MYWVAKLMGLEYYSITIIYKAKDLPIYYYKGIIL